MLSGSLLGAEERRTVASLAQELDTARIRVVGHWKLLPLDFHMAGEFGSALFPF